MRENIKRNEEIVKLHDRVGWHFRKIGAYFGISGQRAHQIYKRLTEKSEPLTQE